MLETSSFTSQAALASLEPGSPPGMGQSHATAESESRAPGDLSRVEGSLYHALGWGNIALNELTAKFLSLYESYMSLQCFPNVTD